MKPSTILLLLLSLLLAQCSWLLPKKEAQPELPPPTQAGKNTFGCYLNGKPWTPKGRAGTISNLNMTYDPDLNNGHLNLSAFRITDENRQDIIIDVDSVLKAGHYACKPIYYDRASGCLFSNDASTYREGMVRITKFDLANEIIAGQFEFVIAKPGCDTVRVTDGRFDSRLY